MTNQTIPMSTSDDSDSELDEQPPTSTTTEEQIDPVSDMISKERTRVDFSEEIDAITVVSMDVVLCEIFSEEKL